MRRSALVVMLLAVLAPDLYSQKGKVKVEYAHSTDFGKFRTYAWKEGHALGQNNLLPLELIGKYVHAAVTRELNARGLKEVTSNPDAFITYFVGLEEKSSVTPLEQYDHFGKTSYQAAESFGSTWDQTMVMEYRKGILLIDLVDAASNSLVWRAHCKETAGNPGNLQAKIDAAARIGFKDFPPKSRK